MHPCCCTSLQKPWGTAESSIWGGHRTVGAWCAAGHSSMDTLDPYDSVRIQTEAGRPVCCIRANPALATTFTSFQYQTVGETIGVSSLRARAIKKVHIPSSSDTQSGFHHSFHHRNRLALQLGCQRTPPRHRWTTWSVRRRSAGRGCRTR